MSGKTFRFVTRCNFNADGLPAARLRVIKELFIGQLAEFSAEDSGRHQPFSGVGVAADYKRLCPGARVTHKPGHPSGRRPPAVPRGD